MKIEDFETVIDGASFAAIYTSQAGYLQVEPMPNFPDHVVLVNPDELKIADYRHHKVQMHQVASQAELDTLVHQLSGIAAATKAQTER